MKQFVVKDRKDIIPKRLDRYLGFPGMVRTGPGEVLLAYRDARSAPNTFSHGADGDMRLIRFAHGRWSEPELLYRHEGGLEEMGCGDLTLLKDGTILLFSRQYDAAHERVGEVYVARSADNGRTFLPRRPVGLPQFPDGWTPYGKVIEMPDGRWLLGGYGRCRPGEGFSAACLVSRDGGEGWGFGSWIAPHDCKGPALSARGFPEPLILRLPDGALFALLRTNGVFYVTSSADGGRTWRLPERAFEGMAAAGLVLSSGEMLVTYRGIHWHVQPPAQRPPTVALRKGRLYCWRVSEDGGATWGSEGVADEGEAYQVGSYGMGDLIELEDGSILVVYYTSDRDQAPWLQQCTLLPR
jgi:hypothetical protein